jgi:hypothetical protein
MKTRDVMVTVRCANGWYSHEVCLDVESGLGAVSQTWEGWKFRDKSSVVYL